MFVVKKHVKRHKRQKGKTMAETKTKVTEVGIIGQMYENRKTKKVGVLESREDKYKTLMMRDTEGGSFNITYSTFKSDWRKYQGEQTVQTSTQIEEQKVDEQKSAESTEKSIKTKSEKIKFSTEDKLKAVRELEKFVSDRVKSVNSGLTVIRNSKGGVIVHAKRLTVFEVWCKYGIDKYDIFFRGTIADAMDKAEFNALAEIPTVEYSEHETWKLCHGYRVENTELGTIVDRLISAGDNYLKLKEVKTENEENEEE